MKFNMEIEAPVLLNPKGCTQEGNPEETGLNLQISCRNFSLIEGETWWLLLGRHHQHGPELPALVNRGKI